MKNNTFLLTLVSVILSFHTPFAQTTETFETETIGATTFADNSQVFTISNLSSDMYYDIESFTGGGWNGAAADNQFIDNSGITVAETIAEDGTSFSISSVSNFSVKDFWLFVSNPSPTGFGNPSSGSVTITGYIGVSQKFTFTMPAANFTAAATFSPNNGFTFINFTNQGGTNYSNIAINKLVISGTNDIDYLALDAFKWDIAAETDAPVFENSTPSESSLTQTSFTLATDIDEAGTIYYVVVPAGVTAPSSANVKAGTASGGGTAITIGSAVVNSGGFTNNFSVTGLTASTAYDVYVVAEDDESVPNLQSTPTKISVTTLVTVSFTALSDLCITAGIQTGLGAGAPSGGVYSGPGVIDGGNGTTYSFNPSSAGVGLKTITYTQGGNAASDDVQVLPSDNASFNYSSSAFCINASDPTPAISGLAGGTFSSAAGLAINPSTGTIDVSASTPNTYTVAYTTAGSCPNSSSVSVTINALDNASFNYSASAYCVNDSDPTPTITGLAGGTFSSAAGLAINALTGAIDVSASTPNTYTVTYTTAGSCPNSSSVSVTNSALDNASFNYSASSYCINDSDPTPTISGLPGGTFSPTAGLVINPSTGKIDVSASTPNTYTVTYTTAGSCPNSSSVFVTINALDNAAFSYGNSAYCVNASDPTPTITGLSGGTFSSTAGLSFNPSTGVIDVSASTSNTYTVTYTTAGSCPNSSSVSVTVNALDNAAFSYGNSAYCVNASDPTPTISGLAGGTFSSTPGLSINASTGIIDLSASTPNTYTVTYTAAGSCPNSSSVSVTINALDNASFNYSSSAFCVNASDPTPTITGLSGGTFSSTAGLSINASTGVIDVSASTPNTYTVTYTTAGSCPNSSSASVIINGLDDAAFSYSLASYCKTAADPIPTISGVTGGIFSSTSGLDINSSTGSIDLSESTAGAYIITYTTAGTCPNSSTVNFTITEGIYGNRTPSAFNEVFACENENIKLGVDITSTTGATFQWQINNGGTFENITAISPYNTVSSDSLTINPASLSLDGSQYRLLASNACAVNEISDTITLKVGQLPVLVSSPIDQEVCLGNSVVLTADFTGGGFYYQWQVNLGSGFINVSGPDYVISNNTLIISNFDNSKNNNQYRAVAKSSCFEVPSNAATITINTDITILAQPTSQTVCEFGTAIFTAQAVKLSAGTLDYQWQRKSGTRNWENINTGGRYTVNGNQLSIANAPASWNGAEFRCLINDYCQTIPKTLNVTSVAHVTQNPVNQEICVGNNAGFSITAAGQGLTYRWQVNSVSGFVNLTDGGIYQGATSVNLSLTFPTAAVNGNQYRCVVSGTSTCDLVADTSGVASISIGVAAEAQTVFYNSPISTDDGVTQAVGYILGINDILAPNGKAEFRAGNAIILNPGFEVQAGAVFKAKIQNPCQMVSTSFEGGGSSLPKEKVK